MDPEARCHAHRCQTILQLPPEILCKICGFLQSFPPALGSLMMTCTQFRDLVTAWQPWKDVCMMRGYLNTARSSSPSIGSEPVRPMSHFGTRPRTAARSEGARLDELTDLHWTLDEELMIPTAVLDHRHSAEPDDLLMETQVEASADSDSLEPNRLGQTRTRSLSRLQPPVRHASQHSEPDVDSVENLVADMTHLWMDSGPRHPMSQQYSIQSRWKDLFTQHWLHETLLSRGQCRVRGSDVHFGTMGAMQMSKDRVYGGFNHVISVWDIASGSPIHRLEGHQNGISCLQICDDVLVSAGYDHTLKVWNAARGSLLKTIPVQSVIRSLRFNRSHVISGGSDGSLLCMPLHVETATRPPVSLPSLHTKEVTLLQFDHRYVVSASADQSIQVLSRLHNRILWCTQIGSFATSLCMSRDLVAAGSWSGRLLIWSLDLPQDPSLLDQCSREPCQARADFAQIHVNQDTLSEGHFERINTIQILNSVISLPNTASQAQTTLTGPRRTMPAIMSGSNDGTVRLWCFEPLLGHYRCTVTLEHEVPILCLELHSMMSTSFHVSAAGLDGRLHHWLVRLSQSNEADHSTSTDFNTSDPAILDSASQLIQRRISRTRLTRYMVEKSSTESTFASSFLPIVLYQDFIQIMIDRPI